MWTYNDWITYDDLAVRLARLRLHIVEVSNHIMGTSTRGQSVTAADQQYLAGLRTTETQLTSTVSRPSIARNKAKFQ